jgi:hypothetical protein
MFHVIQKDDWRDDFSLTIIGSATRLHRGRRIVSDMKHSYHSKFFFAGPGVDHCPVCVCKFDCHLRKTAIPGFYAN